MRGPSLKCVDSFSAIHFVLDDKPVPVFRHAIACDANEDGSLSRENRLLMIECIQKTVDIRNPPIERTVVEYTLTFDADQNIWVAECYI